MAKTVLVVDDKSQMRLMIKAYLEQEGFTVVTAANGREALFVARTAKPDLILLDLMMPEMGGYDFIRAYNREADTPIIIITAKLEESDKVLGLELGADDYVTKPFSLRELTARVRAVMRRSGKAPSETDLLRVGDLVLDRGGRQVTARGETINLTPSEFDLLNIFMSNPGRAFSRFELLDKIQDGEIYEGYERTIDVHIRNLRNKIEKKGEPKYVETVYGVGYRFRNA